MLLRAEEAVGSFGENVEEIREKIPMALFRSGLPQFFKVPAVVLVSRRNTFLRVGRWT